MEKRNILNIVNFMRGIMSEILPEGNALTLQTVKNQIELIDKYNFKATFLMQYDTLSMPEYLELMLPLDKDRYEIGIWYEVIQPLAEDCGIKWRGERGWDGHVHCGYPMGYNKEQRALMIDTFFEKFKSVFGYYPKVFGSWFFDSFTVRHITEKYGLDAMINCKEQYGTDGYTIWGGYYGQAYYPAKKNIFMPAQTADQQVNTPIFKMLGSDQLYQYDYGSAVTDTNLKAQQVITLEPIYRPGGGDPKWVEWYFKENYNGECMSFSYTQAGQENSFGWPRMKDGLIYQFERIHQLQQQGKIQVETLGESGRWYKNTYPHTPASAITAHTAFDDENKSSVWFCNKNYRVNLYSENKHIYIRDIHIFDENIVDPFENKICTQNAAVYMSLPVVDGYLFSGDNKKAGLYLFDKDTKAPISYDDFHFVDNNDGTCTVNYNSTAGSTQFCVNDMELCINRDKDFYANLVIGRRGEYLPKAKLLSDTQLLLKFNGVEYTVTLTKGKFVSATHIESQQGSICAQFKR